MKFKNNSLPKINNIYVFAGNCRFMIFIFPAHLLFNYFYNLLLLKIYAL